MSQRVTLADHQVELVVLALKHVRKLTEATTTTYKVDDLCRQFTRNRIDEILLILDPPKESP